MCDVNVDHTEVFPSRCDCDSRGAERREDKTSRSDFSLFAAVQRREAQVPVELDEIRNNVRRR